jgi:hypothetical protein
LRPRIEYLEIAVRPSAFCRSDDATSITAIVAGPAGINEQRLPFRRDKQRGLAALDVNEIDL